METGQAKKRQKYKVKRIAMSLITRLVSHSHSHTHTHTIDVIVDVRMTSRDVIVGIRMTSLLVYGHTVCDTRLV